MSERGMAILDRASNAPSLPVEITVAEVTHQYSKNVRELLRGLVVVVVSMVFATMRKGISPTGIAAFLVLAFVFWKFDKKTERRNLRLLLRSDALLCRFFRIKTAAIDKASIVMDEQNSPGHITLSVRSDVYEFKNMGAYAQVFLAWLAAFLPGERMEFESKEADD